MGETAVSLGGGSEGQGEQLKDPQDQNKHLSPIKLQVTPKAPKPNPFYCLKSLKTPQNKNKHLIPKSSE